MLLGINICSFIKVYIDYCLIFAKQLFVENIDVHSSFFEENFTAFKLYMNELCSSKPDIEVIKLIHARLT